MASIMTAIHEGLLYGFISAFTVFGFSLTLIALWAFLEGIDRILDWATGGNKYARSIDDC
jgi:hypothetical protein